MHIKLKVKVVKNYKVKINNMLMLDEVQNLKITIKDLTANSGSVGE